MYGESTGQQVSGKCGNTDAIRNIDKKDGQHRIEYVVYFYVLGNSLDTNKCFGKWNYSAFRPKIRTFMFGGVVKKVELCIMKANKRLFYKMVVENHTS